MKLLIFLVVSVFFIGTACATTTPGLNYSYYEGSWKSLPNFFTLTPVKKGTSANLDLSVRDKDISYGFLWQGFITIPLAGYYTFDMNSDDGSKLYIGNFTNNTTPLINIDGVHASNTTGSGTMYLVAGDYPITISFFQNEGDQVMELSWSSSTGLAKEKIPDNAFSHPIAYINYSYYEGTWNSLPDFTTLTPVKTGLASNFDLGIRERETSYGIVWNSFITIPESGSYTFETSSDDGSKLYINTNTTAIVDNDGLHASYPISGTIDLIAGTYPLTVAFFQNGEGQALEVYWSSNTGISRQVIPDIAFVSSPTLVNYSYYEGTWNSLPDFSTLTPVKTGVGDNIDLAMRDRDSSYGVVWKSFINIPLSGDYTFETNSDDGSKIFIDNSLTPIVDNDGIHAQHAVKGTINLTKGIYPITVTFFQDKGENIMELYWSADSIARQRIPSTAFTVEPAPIIAEKPGDGLKGIHNYYFSTSTGNDSRTSDEAQNPATPWKTINQLNTFSPSLLPGDAVLFKRNEIFDGSIILAKSGVPDSSIIFSAYGSGSKPIINGFATASGWTSLGGNIYEAPFQGGSYLNLVTINNEVKAMGKFPNSGSLTIDSRTTVDGPSPVFMGPGTFTDAELDASITNWKGAVAVIRKNDYVLDKCLITDHTGTTVSYYSPSPHTPNVGYGYFIQNDVRTLDVDGEWFYDPANHILKIYSSVDPATLAVKGSAIASLVVADNKNNLIFDNLQFQGSDTSVFNIINGSSDIVIQKCDMNFAGNEIIHAIQVNRITFNNNTIANTNSYALFMFDCDYVTVNDNIIKNVGLLPGMGLSGQAGYGAIYVNGSNTIIERNVVDSIGSCGIAINGGSNILVKNNYVNSFCMTLSDYAGIYTNGDDDFVGRRIIGNIVSNGIGNFQGTTATTPRASNGIYVDELGSNVEVAGNTVFNCVSNGIYLHQAYDNIIRGNTLVGNGLTALSIVDDLPLTERTRNNLVKDNIFYAKTAAQMLLNHGSTANDLVKFGQYDSNFYCRPFDVGGYIATQYRAPSEVYAFYDLAAWRVENPDRDINSRQAAGLIEYTTSNPGENKITNGTFEENTDGVSAGSSTTIMVDAKLDGNALKITGTSTDTLAVLGALINIGPVTAGSSYQIRFSLIGSSNSQNLITYLREFDDPNYQIVSNIKFFSLNTNRTECEYVYKALNDVPDVKLTVLSVGPSLPFWIDNIEARPVDVIYTNIDDSIRFEFNATSSVKTVSFSGVYEDYKKNIYTNQVDLEPYTSIVLLRVEAEESAEAASSASKDSVKASISAVVLSNTTSKASALTAADSKAEQQTTIYPNPVTDILATRLYTGKTGNISMIVLDQTGRVLQSSSYFKKDILFEKKLNVGALHAGFYYLQIKFSDGTSMLKPFVKN